MLPVGAGFSVVVPVLAVAVALTLATEVSVFVNVAITLCAPAVGPVRHSMPCVPVSGNGTSKEGGLAPAAMGLARNNAGLLVTVKWESGESGAVRPVGEVFNPDLEGSWLRELRDGYGHAKLRAADEIYRGECSVHGDDRTRSEACAVEGKRKTRIPTERLRLGSDW